VKSIPTAPGVVGGQTAKAVAVFFVNACVISNSPPLTMWLFLRSDIACVILSRYYSVLWNQSVNLDL
jgi:hypothetical protein